MLSRYTPSHYILDKGLRDSSDCKKIFCLKVDKQQNLEMMNIGPHSLWNLQTTVRSNVLQEAVGHGLLELHITFSSCNIVTCVDMHL